jgi:hypothetical protein
MLGHYDEIRYQVFVSSTFTDLKEEREKVLQAILENRAFPAGMELFPAADDEQFEFIKREIESSDYYIVIIAGRYGSVAQDGLSFTEKEYDFAISIGKPVLTFLHKDIGKLIGDKLEPTDEAKANLKRFREKAKTGKMVAFYENPDDLKARVLHALSQSFNFKPMRGWVRAGQTSRTDLERIAELQERVLQLESENKRLHQSQDESVTLLASGEHQINWNLDMRNFEIDDHPLTISELEVKATWDEMLLVVFPGGSSFINEDRLRYLLARWILSKIPKNVLKGGSKAAMDSLGIFGDHTSTSSAVERIRIDLHRQFPGLGLLSESREVIYIPTYGQNQPSPKSELIWRLTEKGEKYIAFKRGFMLPNGPRASSKSARKVNRRK